MTTTVTSTIKSAGGDYTSLSAWEAAKQADITLATGSDEIQQAECYDFTVTESVNIDGWTTDAGQYIRVYTPQAERHAGTIAAGFRITSSSSSAIAIAENYVRIEGLVVKAAGDDSGIQCNTVSGVGDVRVSHNVVVSNTGTSSGAGIDFNNTGSSVVVRISNNIVYDFRNATNIGYGIGFLNSTATAYVYNNTIYNCRRGIVTGSANQKLINNICDSNEADYAFAAGPHASSSNNTSSDTSVSTFGTQSVTPAYVDEANDDFHLDAGDTVAAGNGADLSADSDLPVTDDIDGEARSTWEIGADELTAGGGGGGSILLFVSKDMANITDMKDMRG